MKVAICGVWHVHAIDYTRQALRMDNVEIIGFYEPDKTLRDEYKAKVDIYEFESLDALLSSDADVVIVCSSTDTHIDYMLKIAEAKKDIFTEKVLAMNVEDCNKIKKAIVDNGIRFAISYVQKFNPSIKKAKEIVDSGELGRINYLRYRNCHSGSVADWLPKHFYSIKECGGGAMIDLGAHGMYLTEWFLGMPEKYSSAFNIWDKNDKNTDNIEDNAVTIMSYADGTIAINETGFVSVGCPMTLEVGGDKGYVRYIRGECLEKTTTADGGKRTDISVVEDKKSPLNVFLSGGTPDACGIDEAIRLTEMMEKAYKNIK